MDVEGLSKSMSYLQFLGLNVCSSFPKLPELFLARIREISLCSGQPVLYGRLMRGSSDPLCLILRANGVFMMV